MQKNRLCNSDPLIFISSNIACCAFSILYKFGVIKSIIESKEITEEFIASSSHPDLIKTSLQTLKNYQILKKSGSLYKLSKLGREIYKNVGTIELIHDGYGLLLANYLNIYKNRSLHPESLINGRSIASASIAIAEQGVDPVVFNELKKLSIQGTICDLGCGSAASLLKICKKTGLKGLGIELNDDALKLARESLGKKSPVKLIKGDIAKVTGKYEDVEVLMHCFAMHDITPGKQCIRVLKSYLEHFPNMRYFFYIDSVAHTEKELSFLPGFDFIHALLGIPVRTYDETLSLFKNSGYQILKEKALKQIPNSYLWILKPLTK
ncbi:MAG: methyltransferase domain-containing protein [Simkania sp.]|nr:methyltransferase domain-containing protein [Simkania sp.]